MKKTVFFATALLALAVTGCAMGPTADNGWTLPKPQPGIAQREQEKLNRSDHRSEQQQIAKIKTMFAERNAYNRKPVAVRGEGKSQGAGDCRRVTITAQAIPLNVLLKSLAGKRTLRIINEKGEIPMDAPVNIYADDECDEEVIDRVLTNMDIAYTLNNEALTVMPRVAKTYHLPILRPKDKYRSSSRASGINGRSGTSSGQNSQANSGGEITYEDDEDNDPFKELEANIKSILGKGSTVVMNKTEGSMTVVARPSEHRKVEHLVADFNKTMTKTVMVTANILEVNVDDLEEHGLSINALLKSFKNATTGGLNVATDFATLVQGAGNGQVRFFKTSGNKTIFDIQAILRSRGIRFRQRTTPSITVDNRSGTVLSIGGSEQYVESITLAAGTTVGGTTQTLPAPKLGILQTGVQLDVWPYVMDDDEIIAQLRLSITDKKGVKTFTFQNVGSFESPILSTTQVNTKVSVNSGDTIVITGLTREISDNNNDGLPGISKVPGLSDVLGHKKNHTTRSEAVIFLTLEHIDQNQKL